MDTPSSDQGISSAQTGTVLRLGTRQSPLAMAQAREVRSRLCGAHDWPEDAIKLVPVIASGDKITDRPLAEIGGKALWTRELDVWLSEGRIDAAVHSLKDVETIRPTQFTIAAILPRADRRDVLIGAPSLAELRPGARVGTSAPRRAAQLLNARPDCEVVPFRGNVATRLAKLAAGEADATFLAKAGLDRLGETGVGSPLELDQWLPAVAQGAIAVECRADAADTIRAIAAIDDDPSRASALAERALLAELGGTCHSPIGVLAEREGDTTRICASLYSRDGAELVSGQCDVADAEAIRGLAADLLKRATPGIAALFSGPGR